MRIPVFALALLIPAGAAAQSYPAAAIPKR